MVSYHIFGTSEKKSLVGRAAGTLFSTKNEFIRLDKERVELIASIHRYARRSAT